MITIRQARIDARLTQRSLSEAAGVNIRLIQKLESGEASVSNITTKNAVAIARALGVSAEDLLGM